MTHSRIAGAGGRAASGFTRRQAIGIGGAALVGLATPGRAASIEDRLATLGERATRPLRLLLPQGSEDNLAPIVTAFTRASGCEVDLRIVPFDDVSSVLTLGWLSGESEIDVALPATFALPDLVEVGALMPFDDLAAEFEPPGLVEGMLYDTGNQYEGKRFGYQTDGDIYTLFLNKRLFEDGALRAGYEDRHGEALAVPLTWEELDRQMSWFAGARADTFGGTLFRNPGRITWEFWLRLHGKGVWPAAADLTPGFDSEEGVAALEEMIAISSVQVDAPDILGERYGMGDAYANLGWGGTQKQLQRNSPMRGELIFASPPGGQFADGPLTLPYFNWGWSYVVFAGSQMQELSYLFCLMAVQPDLSTQAVRRDQGFFDPFRKEHYDDSVIREVYSDTFLETHCEILSRAIPDFYLPGRTQYFGRLGTWLSRAVTGTVDPRTALSEAARDWTTITLESDAGRQARHWQALRAVYPEPLRGALREPG